ncbi:hypothetical protein FHT00_003456 [Sphingomonas insulae]|nr:hypothetical protein [Sphingomonas insulae]NIJ31476.1 hypothetical protein [Sphingomonas insulae]
MALSLLQVLSYQVPAPLSRTEQQAELSLRRADEGRALARRFLCQDERRFDRLRELDERFAFIKSRFSQVFNHSWRDEANGFMQLDEKREADIGRKDDCRLRDSFAAGMTDYENGLLAAQAELSSIRQEFTN